MPRRGVSLKKRKPRKEVKPKGRKKRPKIKTKEVPNSYGENTSAQNVNKPIAMNTKPEQKPDYSFRRRDEWVTLLAPLSNQDEMSIPVAVLLDLLVDEVSLLEKTLDELCNQATAIQRKAESEINTVLPDYRRVTSKMMSFCKAEVI